jgi:hypothetical protein
VAATQVAQYDFENEIGRRAQRGGLETLLAVVI